MSSLPRGNHTRGSVRTRAIQRGSSISRSASVPTGDKRAASPRARGSPRAFAARGQAKSSIANVPHQSFRKSGLSNVQNAKGSWQERYFALQESRKHERSDAIKRGRMADPDKPTTLAEAITLVGTCQDMCAEFERVERVVQKDVWKEEVDPTRTSANSLDREPDESRMVKKFRRAAAGIEEQLPSDLRPPAVLQMTCNYLFSEVISAARDLPSVHHFVWDRTRAVRNDFSIQQLSRPEDLSIAINCYEQIARFHILSLHQLALPEKPYDKYDWQQEREQLDRTLLSLIQYYDDSRGKVPLPNESEFRAYCVIFQLRNPDPDLEEKVQTWPADVANHPRVRAALELYAAASNTNDSYGPLKPNVPHATAQQDWHHVWRLIESRKLSYLMGCVAEIHFNMVRENVLHALLRSGGIKNMTQWSLEELRDMMAFDSEESLVEFCARYDLAFVPREGRLFLDFSQLKNRSLPSAKANAAKQSKTQLVEQKRGGRAFTAVINGLSFKQASEQNLIVEEDDSEMEDVSEQAADDQSSEDGLFVSEAKEKPQQSVFDQGIKPAQSIFEQQVKPPMSNPRFASTTFGQPSTPQIDFTKPSTPVPIPSTFGKPSAASSAGVSTFGQPSAANITSSQSSKSPSIFAQGTKQPETDGPPVFDFLAGLKQTQASTKAAAMSVSKATSSTETTLPQTNNALKTTNNPFSFMTTKQPATETSTMKTGLEALKTPFNFSTPSPASHDTTKTDARATDVTKKAALPAFDLSQAPTATTSASESSSSLFATKPFTSESQSETVSKPHSVLKTDYEPLSQPPKSVHFDFKAASPTTSAIFQPKSTGPASSSSFESPPSNQSNSKGQQGAPPPPKQLSAQPIKESPRMPDLGTIVNKLAREVTCEPKTGFLKQYIDFVVGQIITEVQEAVYNERVEDEARQFREHVLTLRYGRLWRMLYRHARLTKQARERRNRAFRRLNDHKSQTSAASSTVGEGSVHGDGQSRGAGTAATVSKRDRVDELFRQTNGVSKWAKIAADHERARQTRRQSIASQASEDGASRQHRTTRVDASGRIVKPTATGLPPKYAYLQTSPPVKSTTKSNYFRLKALGLDKIDASLASSRKRAYSELSSEASESSLQSSTVPSRLQIQSIETNDTEPPESPRSKMLKMYDEEDALFARLRAARENLQEGMSFYQTEVAKSTSPQSAAQAKTTSYDSPSMQRARQEARWRLDGADVPAYRLRESKFVSNWPGAASQLSQLQLASPSPAYTPNTANADITQTPSHENHTHSSFAAPEIQAADGYANTQASYQSFTMREEEPEATQEDHVSRDEIMSTPAIVPFSNQDDNLATIGHSQGDLTTLSPSQNHDFTIKPSQIPESLAASFGPPRGPDSQDIAKSVLRSFNTASSNDNNNGATWSFDLPHDAEPDHSLNGGHVVHDAESDISNRTNGYQHQNPYSVLQDEHEASQDYDAEEYSMKTHDLDVDQYQDGQVYYNEQQADMSDANRSDTDVDDGEAQSDEDEDEEDAMDERQNRSYPGFDDEQADSEEYDSEASEDDDAYGHQAAPVNEALQTVGNTEEDAIELSD